MNFDDFWTAWPRSVRKGGKSSCKAKWDKLKLDVQGDQIVKHVEWMKTTEQWLKSNGAFIPAPLVYLNQQRWDGAEIPEVEVKQDRDPYLVKLDQERKNFVPMPEHLRLKMESIKRGN